MPGIADDQAVGLEVAEHAQIGLQPLKVAVVGKDVDRDIDLDPVRVGVGNGLAQTVFVEIAGPGTEAEGLAAEIHGVGAVMDGGHQFVKAAGRRQEFGQPGATVRGWRERRHGRLERYGKTGMGSKGTRE
jgi:hypothetical protein